MKRINFFYFLISVIIIFTSYSKDDSGTNPLAFDWKEVITDANESWQPNIDKVYLKTTNDNLFIKLVTFGNWNNPTNINDGISFGVFLDTDQNINTGLNHTTDYTYYINNIGADFLLNIEFEGQGVYKWNDSLKIWSFYKDIANVVLNDNTNVLEFSVSLANINTPIKFDLAALLITSSSTATDKWDWAPDSTYVTSRTNKFNSRIMLQ